MCRKLVFLVSLALVLGAAGSASAELILHWAFDDGAGSTAVDRSGNGYNGTLEGDPKWVAGKIGGALDFGGDGDHVINTTAGSAIEGLSALTVALWIKSDVIGTDSGFIIFEDPQGRDTRNIRYDQDMGGGLLNGVKYGVCVNPGDTDDDEDESPPDVQTTEWQHIAVTWISGAGAFPAGVNLYIDGVLQTPSTDEPSAEGVLTDYDRVMVGKGGKDANGGWDGLIDDVRIYDEAMSAERIQGIMVGEGFPFSLGPDPEDGAIHPDTWVNLSWSAGDFAVSHDVYFGDSFDNVNNGAGDTFRGNQDDTFYIAGFPGFAFPDGLIPGTTYYWRIDEVNEAEPNSPWKGNVWSFSVPPKTAYFPDPIDGAEFVDLDATLNWTPGFGSKLHTVYLGDSFEDVNNAAGGLPQGAATYTPAGPLESEKVYYWRVDEFDVAATHKGDIWSFTTPGAVGNSQPANGAVDVHILTILNWTPADTAASSDLYFGADADAVKNATTASPEYIGNKALGSESYDPGKLALDAAYYWCVDAVYPDKTVKGLLWSFTTAAFIAVDDFEAYNDIDPPDPNSNRIFDKWIDGFGTTDNGALVGNDLPPYAELNDVHGGGQAMPYRFDNANKTSEATLTLVNPRDFTEGGMTKLSLWFKGDSGNAAERMFVALNGNVVVYHDDPAVAQIGRWTEWVIEQAAFAGVDLTNVDSITIGFGTKGSPAAGGAGAMLFDDIRLVK
ncbi:MAG: hypothetical protein CEE38_00125 [Planctomycetes bacterium B3_Pla]|nr:MAG: hypothetical protein CEE38_00125 [Planctomycetes bacterium B3_Pla]